ncbi:hypothetical protein NUM_48340 [Actinocatenispora comari]|uniref:DUF1737 domain-containing protein n=2 Tax=Actinocatenispora comari TaxID=2807577 RepID=A0A8J4AFA2_9ACTN|nr:hypothetical protein NUM_48340 [Actinocatenispora comari]
MAHLRPADEPTTDPPHHELGRLMDHLTERMRYRLLTGPDDNDFCARVSAALDEGYELYGSPSITARADGQVVAAQAVVLPAYEAVRIRKSPASADPVS